jgi:hypothetical protein
VAINTLDGKVDVEDLLEKVDYSNTEHYIPTDFSLEFIQNL